MSEQFSQWLDVDASEVLERWYTSGLPYEDDRKRNIQRAGGCQPLPASISLWSDENVRMVGHRLAQACLELKDTYKVAKFWISFPFAAYDLDYTLWENRLNVLDRALENPEFNAWLRAGLGLDKDRKWMLIRGWTLLGEHLNSISWSTRSDKAGRPQLAKICTELWMERYPAGTHGHSFRAEQWMWSAPRHPHTREVIEETIAAHRRAALAKLMPSNPARAKTRGRMF